MIPNYLEGFLSRGPPETTLNVFANLWRAASSRITHHASRPSSNPPAASANDYRFLQSFGLAPVLDYTGFDLCCQEHRKRPRALSGVRFEVATSSPSLRPTKRSTSASSTISSSIYRFEGLELAVARNLSRHPARYLRWLFQSDDPMRVFRAPMRRISLDTLSNGANTLPGGRDRFRRRPTPGLRAINARRDRGRSRGRTLCRAQRWRRRCRPQTALLERARGRFRCSWHRDRSRCNRAPGEAEGLEKTIVVGGAAGGFEEERDA